MIENFTHRTADRNFARRQRPVDFAAEGSRLALCFALPTAESGSNSTFLWKRRSRP